MFPCEEIRNIAINAHVCHGKTTLVDCLLQPFGTLGARTVMPGRGITILSENTAIGMY